MKLGIFVLGVRGDYLCEEVDKGVVFVNICLWGGGYFCDIFVLMKLFVMRK